MEQQHIAELAVDPARAVVFEHGWQSWSPTRAYRLDERPLRPVSAARQVMNHRPGRAAPGDAWSGEGLLAIVSPDIAAHVEPADGDLSQPSQRAAAGNCRSRAWQHGRFWVNDSDCLIAAPTVERRADWAAVVESCGGLRASSDRLRDLDEWGLETTRRLVRPVPATPFDAPIPVGSAAAPAVRG